MSILGPVQNNAKKISLLRPTTTLSDFVCIVHVLRAHNAKYNISIKIIKSVNYDIVILLQ